MSAGLATHRYPLNTEQFSSAPLGEVAARVRIPPAGRRKGTCRSRGGSYAKRRFNQPTDARPMKPSTAAPGAGITVTCPDRYVTLAKSLG